MCAIIWRNDGHGSALAVPRLTSVDISQEGLQL